MGRFEKQPDNPRVRGEISRAAETALWGVVEDLENLQQHVLRSLQEDVKRLQADKNRLSDEIQRLVDEKQQLQQVRQITEQQVLIRQLAEALAKHISSQLQSSLTTLASQTLENTPRAGLKSEQSLSTPETVNNEKVEQLFGALDNTLSITFNSLQQEIKSYQGNISQQLSQMRSQQQQGEAILTELINRLEGLEKTVEETSLKVVNVSPSRESRSPEQPAVKVSSPTVLQLSEPEQNGYFKPSPQLGGVTSQITEPISVIPRELPASETTLEPVVSSLITPAPTENSPEPISVIPRELPASETTLEPVVSSLITPAPTENSPEPISVIPRELPASETTLEPVVSSLITPAPTENSPEPISVIPRELPASETTLEPVVSSTMTPAPTKNSPEPISVIPRELPASETTLEPVLSSTMTPAPTENSPEPISVIPRELPERKIRREPTPLSRREKATPPTPSTPRAQTLSPIQIGFLLIVLSTVLSSLYNVAIKVLFQEGSQVLGVTVEGLILPNLGNTFLILMLRLLVVVPLMLMLAPMMHSQIWEDLQNLFDSAGAKPNSTDGKKPKTLQLSIASGCCLFLSQVLIYIAIGQITTGAAIALFFIYPIISGLLSWLLFRDRPSLFRSGAIGALFCGELLVLGGASSTSTGNVVLGSSAAIFAGIAFSAYVILTRLCANKVHPVSLTLINFTTMLLLSCICLLIPLPSDWSLNIDMTKILEIILTAFILGVLTLCSYVLNNIGISKLGASRSAIIGASVPILTVIFAGLIIQDSLEIVQILGVLLVTFSAAAFSFESLQNQVKSSSSTN
ncbi:MAG: EamA family transporter [Gloeotrichia echinulata IR180]